jgi:hypothetical protein
VKVPSTTFLTSLSIQEIERRMPYYHRKLEMVSGKMLSGDHSHKIAKVILIEGKRGFQGLYTVMNEFGKIVGFWLVNSTNMREVEQRLRDIERRYRLHGFQGPHQFTVDTCCATRQFLAGTNNDKKEPVFPTLVRGSGSHSDTRQPDTRQTGTADTSQTDTDATRQTDTDATRQTDANAARQTGADATRQTDTDAGTDAARQTDTDAAHQMDADAARQMADC